MIHFPKLQNVEIEAWLAHQKGLRSGSYDSEDILDQLHEDFHGKCYICEFTATSIRIEHFRPQSLGKDQKFDWFNIFYGCEHCNAIKSDDYLNLIDCTKDHPDAEISFEVDPLATDKDKVSINRVNGSQVHDDTLNLLRAIYSTHCDYPRVTKRKKLEASNIVRELLKELNDFKELAQEYLDNQDAEDLEDLQFELNNESKFTAFKRWIVRNNVDLNQELHGIFVN